MKTDKEDINLIASLKKGDSYSLELLFRRLYPQMCAYANKFLQDMPEAEEVVQEVFYCIWKNREKIDEHQSLKAYLFTAVKNNCFNILEHNKVKNRYTELLLLIYKNKEHEISSHDSLVASELEKDFSKALEKLPPDCRRIFELSRFEGLKYHEIADQLNISIKTVETQMSRALYKIRLQLRDYLVAIILFHLHNH